MKRTKLSISGPVNKNQAWKNGKGKNKKDLGHVLNSEYGLPWTTISLDFDGWDGIEVEVVKKIIGTSCVENLEIYGNADSEDSGACGEKLKNNFEELLLQASRLKSLRIDFEILNLLCSTSLSQELNLILSQIEKLAIVPSRSIIQSHLMSTIPRNSNIFSNFTETFPCMRLKSLEQSVTTGIPGGSSLTESIMEIVEKNQNTLEDLTLVGEIWERDRMKRIKCPALKSLTVHLTSHGSKARSILIHFIQNQPLLQSINLVNIFNMTNFGSIRPLDLYQAIQRRSTQLRKLHLRDDYVKGDNRTFDVDWSWDFIGQLKFLEDLKVDVSVSKIMSVLPVSLKKLEVCGEESTRREQLAMTPLLPITSALANLPNLTKLNLWARNSLSDPTLHFICSNMVQLVELGFKDSDHVTDFGITGTRGEENAGISLKNLKGT